MVINDLGSDNANYQKGLIEIMNLYFQEKIAFPYSRKDDSGMVFLMNGDSLESIKSELDELFLVKNGSIAFELIPISPLKPLEMLLSQN